MVTGFVVETISTLKILGPLLAQAHLYGISPRIFIPEYRKGKPYDTVTPQLLIVTFPYLTEQDIHTYGTDALDSSVQKQQVDRLVLLNPYRNFSKEVIALANRNIEVFGLDYFINSIYVAASQDDSQKIEDSLSKLTSRVVASDFWRDLEFRVQPNHQKWATKFHSLGSTLLDAFDGVSEEQARQKLSLLQDKPIVSVFTPNIRDHQAYFFYGPATVYALHRLAQLLRRYCDERGYYLVVKSRAKQWDAKPFLKVADHYIQDLPEQIYPSTSTLLLKASRLALHFGSMMVLEAAGIKVPSIAFAPDKVDKLHAYMRPEVRALLKDAVLSTGNESLMNFKNVSRSVSMWPTLKHFSNLADSMNTSLVEAEYEEFNTKFSGWDTNTSATGRILKHFANESI